MLVSLAAACGDEEEWPEGPTADFSATPLCDLVVALGLTGDASVAGDSPIVAYRWSFGDGTSAFGMAVEHRYAQPGTVEIGLTVTDANGLGALEVKTLPDQTPCLSVASQSVTADSSNASPQAELQNDSDRGALVSVVLDVAGADGLLLAEGIDGGQHPIGAGSNAVFTSTAGPIACGSRCADFDAGTVVPRVTNTYWCDPAGC
jgi:hypothetical protein